MKITDKDLRLVERVPLASAGERDDFRQRHLAHGAHVDEEGNLLCDECDTIWFTVESFQRWGPFRPMGAVEAEGDGGDAEIRELSGELPTVDVSRRPAGEALAPQSTSRPIVANPFLED